ncbi:iron chelate uptake ABC transporter family permease subunit [Paenarthrobacter nitroguajacolicus]
MDLIAMDDDSPRVLGIGLSGSRLLLLSLAVLLTAGAASSVGVIAFVGLVAPHAARTLTGARHSRVLPVAARIGACRVVLADVIGRTVVAPVQIPGRNHDRVSGRPLLRVSALAFTGGPHRLTRGFHGFGAGRCV